MYGTFQKWRHVYACDEYTTCSSSQKVALETLQDQQYLKMKLILVLLASALSMAQAARLGLLRVDSYGPTKKRPTALTLAEFGNTRNLRKEDAFVYV
jgi:hypothetical protein